MKLNSHEKDKKEEISDRLGHFFSDQQIRKQEREEEIPDKIDRSLSSLFLSQNLFGFLSLEIKKPSEED